MTGWGRPAFWTCGNVGALLPQMMTLRITGLAVPMFKTAPVVTAAELP